MSWYLGSVNIVVTEYNETNSQIIARLQPLASGTVHHIFGYEDPTVKLSAVVVGESDRAALENYSKTSLTYNLMYSSTEGIINYGDYLVKSVTARREPVIRQSIRQDLDCKSPVYSTEIELLYDQA